MREKISAQVLVAHLDQDKIFRFLLSPSGVYSYSFQYDQRFSLSSQLKSFLTKTMNLNKEKDSLVEVFEGFKEQVNQNTFLYFALVKGPVSGDLKLSCLSFHECLSAFSQKKSRLVFLKSFQLLSDDKSHLIEAREVLANFSF